MIYSKEDATVIVVRDVIGSEMCVTQSDGDLVFKKIYEAFQRGERINLSFAGIQFVISAFLNPALGLLYKYYDTEYLNSNLKITEITKQQREMVREVLRNAKEYWLNKEGAQENLDEAISDQS